MEEQDPTALAHAAAPVQGEAFLEYLYLKYGFMFPPEGPLYSNLPSWQAPLPIEVISTLRRKVFDSVSALDVTEDLPRHVFRFVGLLRTTEGPPASLWDLHPIHERRLVRADAPVYVDVALRYLINLGSHATKNSIIIELGLRILISD